MAFLGVFLLLTVLFYSSALQFPKAKEDILPSTAECGVPKCKSFGFVGVEFALRTRRCVAGIIGKRHVLTYKRCWENNFNERTRVTVNMKCCDKSERNFEVKDAIIHESSQIVLLKLRTDIDFEGCPNPLCLPFDDFKRAGIEENVFSSGDRIQDRYIYLYNVIDNKFCVEEDADNLICLRKTIGMDRATCYGDDGSLILNGNEDQWFIEGVLDHASNSSFKSCDMSVPVRGFRINEEILEWIVDNVQP